MEHGRTSAPSIQKLKGVGPSPMQPFAKAMAILSPSPQPPHKPTTHTQISLRVFSQTPKPALPQFLPHRTGLAPDLSFPFPAFFLLSSNQQACTRLFIHHVYGFLRFGVWNHFLDFRSTHLHPLSQDMLLSNGFAGVPGVRRWSSPSPPSLGRWRVLSKR
jgi:hypothetical protein